MNRIKLLRLEHGLSQRALALKVGCSQKAVDCWEKGLSEPTAGFICSLADCFSCTTDYLLGREDELGNVGIPPFVRSWRLMEFAGGLSDEQLSLLEEFAEFLVCRSKKQNNRV